LNLNPKRKKYAKRERRKHVPDNVNPNLLGIRTGPVVCPETNRDERETTKTEGHQRKGERPLLGKEKVGRLRAGK